MKHLLLTTIAAVVLMGCGESQHLAAGTDVNEKDGNGWSPLHYATHYAYEAGNNHEDIAKKC